MPWPVQNGKKRVCQRVKRLLCCDATVTSFPAILLGTGLFCATFYHFFVHDQTGPIGSFIRRAFPKDVRLGLDESTFAAVFVSLFMQIVGILQMPRFLGPGFSPFSAQILTYKKASYTAASSKQDGVNGNRKIAKAKRKSKQKES